MNVSDQLNGMISNEKNVNQNLSQSLSNGNNQNV